MTKLNSYLCDMCQNIFSIKERSVPVKWVRITSEGTDDEERYELHVCTKCENILDIVTDGMCVKEVSKLLDKLTEEETNKKV